MIRTISMRDTRGKIHNIDLELERGDLDLAKAITNATKEYCMSNEGRHLLDSEKPITFETFIKDIPNKTCVKYGFIKSGHTMSDISVECDTPVLSREDMLLMNRTKGLRHSKGHKVSEVAMHFARIFGVMETLDEQFNNLSFEDNIENMVTWAKEFVETGQTDIPSFFEKHLKELM